ncbi:MAG TPA: response regulator transcription factor [Acidimicrobiia bacterium]|nr:response regulator transcription factor [Acidimicrobiia bacterium]
MTTVLVADDHQLVRQALRRALDDAGLCVVSEASDGEEAVRLAKQLEPDVVVMDVTMPILDGIQATKQIYDTNPSTKIVILTMHSEDKLIRDAIQAGAVAFLSKDCAMQEVVDTVKLTATGEVFLSPELADSMLQAFAEPQDESDQPEVVSPLTKREEEILQEVADGKSTAEVARDLFISPKTVKNHLASIYVKLEARDRTQAVLSGVKLGIVALR